MDHDEEQRNELEALEAIFAQDFQRQTQHTTTQAREMHATRRGGLHGASSCLSLARCSASVNFHRLVGCSSLPPLLCATLLPPSSVTSADPPRSFELVIVPNADGSNNHVSVRLIVELPATYPEVAATIRVRNERALLERQIAELTSLVSEKSAASVGEVSIYLIAEAVREWLVENNKPVLSMHEQMEARANSKNNEEEERLAKRRAMEARAEEKKAAPSPLGIEPGTLLTPESFAHWRALFDAEQRAIREAKEAAKPKMDRLTGKQLFQQNLARDLGEDEADKLVEEAAPAPKPKQEIFVFNESLFTEELDDEEFDDEEDEDEDGEDNEEDEAEEGDLSAMFDTTTGAEKALKAATIGGGGAGAGVGAGVGSSASASSSSSSSSAAAKKPAAASSSAASSSSASSSSAAAPAPRPAAAAAPAPAPSRSPPGFGGAQSAAAPKPNQQQQQQQKPQPPKLQGGAGAGGKQQQQQASQKGQQSGGGGGGDKKKGGKK